MVHYATVLVCALLVGISSAYPQTRRTQNYRRQTENIAPANADAALTDADAALTDDNALVVDAAVATPPPALASRVDVPQDAVNGDNDDGVDAEENALGLPSNATSIRAKIVDTFSCEGRVYGYYADVENECQVFHVCLPVQQPGSKGKTFKWSFICPEQTIFNQEKFTCTRAEDSLPCEEAPQYFRLNDNFGVTGKPDESRSDALASRSAVDGDVEEVAPAVTEAAVDDAVEATTPFAES